MGPRSIFVTTPLLSSKNLVVTWSQPPSLSMVNSAGGSGNSFLFLARTDSSTGR
jgi:hypothetical protein